MSSPTTAQLLEMLPDGAALLSREGRVTLANRRIAALLGVSVMHKTVLELTRSAEAGELAAAALNGRVGRLELTLPVARRTLQLHFSPLEEGALVYARDVTAEKRMELARRDFVANASHELRTPVTAISGAAETLLDGAVNDPSAARSFVEMISRHATRLSQLTQELLDLSRIESGEWRLDLAPLELAVLGRSVAELFRARVEQKQIRFVEGFPAGLKVRADRRALEQILVNFVDNAVKYTPCGGQVTLGAELAGEGGAEVVLSVLDTGPGIERHHVERVFERFYRADKGRARDAGGTGLGLAIVKHLAEAQGGEVGVDTGPQGSRFWVRLGRG